MLRKEIAGVLGYFRGPLGNKSLGRHEMSGWTHAYTHIGASHSFSDPLHGPPPVNDIVVAAERVANTANANPHTHISVK